MAPEPVEPLARASDLALPASAPRRVVLVGFMGAGKTTVGRLLATQLGWRFEDLDRLVETSVGRSIAALFAEQGEAAFRAVERDAAARCLGFEACVLATGGGAWAEPETRALLARDALTIWLRADVETLLARLPADGSRPLLGNRERMRALMDQREPLYASADVTIAALGTPHQIAARLAAIVESRGVRPSRGTRHS